MELKCRAGGQRLQTNPTRKMTTTPLHSQMNNSSPDMSFWPVPFGEIRFQVHTPALSKVVQRLKGFRLVGYSVKGAYLKLFQGKMNLRKAEAFVKRHLVSKGADTFT